MNLQAKNTQQYRQAAEVLYALDASRRYNQPAVSKIALQKLIYLSVILSPIKNIIIHFLRFQYQQRGPFDYEVQNIVDHLMGLDYVKLVHYNFKHEKRILVSYSITEKGIKAVQTLIKFDREAETQWWINCVCRLAVSYSKGGFESEFEGLNRIVDFVYKDPTFLKNKSSESFRTGIDIGGDGDETRELINFAKEYIESNNVKIEAKNERRVAEIILLLYFEYLNARVLNYSGND